MLWHLFLLVWSLFCKIILDLDYEIDDILTILYGSICAHFGSLTGYSQSLKLLNKNLCF
jgi:hypothetical protein